MKSEIPKPPPFVMPQVYLPTNSRSVAMGNKHLERYEDLNQHRMGIFKRKAPISTMLSWTKVSFMYNLYSEKVK